jgi:cytochrome c-type biogenesis protein CcmH/NrfG
VDLGQIFFSQKRYDEALEAFTKAWKLGSPQGRIGMDNVAAATQHF